MEEYLALTEGRPRREQVDLARSTKIVKPKRKGTPLKGMKSALKKANSMARKKNGSFKKGWDQARVMSTAHKIRRRG